jgi:HAD superfamily hydrolase (TIGR01509 family)
MIKAVVFDCFGVLVGSGFWNVYQSLGGDPVKNAAFIDDVLNRADGGIMSAEELRDIMSKHLGVSPDEYAAAYNNDEVPNLQVFDFIRTELKPHYKIGLLSNAGPGVVQRRIPPELLSLFDAVVVSGEVGLLKPDPAIFRLVAEQLHVTPEEAVFTDDHAPYLPGATAVGMHPILFKGLDDFRRQFSELATTR